MLWKAAKGREGWAQFLSVAQISLLQWAQSPLESLHGSQTQPCSIASHVP